MYISSPDSTPERLPTLDPYLDYLVVILNLTFPKVNTWLPGHKPGLTPISPILVVLYPTHKQIRFCLQNIIQISVLLYAWHLAAPPSLTGPSAVVSQRDFLLLVYSIPFNRLTQQPQVCFIHKSHLLLIVKLQWLPTALGLKPKPRETSQDAEPSRWSDVSRQLPSLPRLRRGLVFLLFLEHAVLTAAATSPGLSGRLSPSALPSCPHTAVSPDR